MRFDDDGRGVLAILKTRGPHAERDAVFLYSYVSLLSFLALNHPTPFVFQNYLVRYCIYYGTTQRTSEK